VEGSELRKLQFSSCAFRNVAIRYSRAL